MTFRKLRMIREEQSGFTLIELIAVVAITACIGFGAAAATGQILTQAPRNADYSSASSQVANAIHWMSRDAQMAQTVATNGVSGFPLTLSWTEWDNSAHQVTYTLDNEEIERSYSIDGAEPSETLVAQYVSDNAELTSCNFTGEILFVKVTAIIGEGSHAVQVTRLREVTPRPGL